MIYQHAAEERDRTIADRLGEMIADEREPKVVRIDKATRGRSRSEAPPDVARTLHDGGAS